MQLAVGQGVARDLHQVDGGGPGCGQSRAHRAAAVHRAPMAWEQTLGAERECPIQRSDVVGQRIGGGTELDVRDCALEHQVSGEQPSALWLEQADLSGGMAG